MDTYIIHPTTLDKLSCRLQHHWSRQYQTMRTSKALEFGKAIHYALEEYYGKKIHPVVAFKKYMLEDNFLSVMGLENSDVELGVAMLSNYIDTYKNTERFVVISTEQEIARRVPIPKDDTHPAERSKQLFVAARVDAIVYDKSVGQTFVLEHKTFENFYPQFLQLNHQFVIEKYVADGFLKKTKYPPTAGVIYNGLRKRAKPNNTTKLFERHPLYIIDEQVKVMLHRVYWKLLETSSAFYPVFPEPSQMTCQFCEFKQPCIEYQRGGDWKFYLTHLFKERVEEDEEWV